MLFNTNPRTYLILECILITGQIQYFYIENLASNTLNHLDTNNIPVRCFKIKDLDLGNSVLVKETVDKTKVINLHLNTLLSYSNITKRILIIDLLEFINLTKSQCDDGCINRNKELCSLDLDGDMCRNYIRNIESLVEYPSSSNDNISRFKRIKKYFSQKVK